MHNKKSRKQKGQVWLSDYTISMLIFVLAMVLSFKIIINSFSANTTYEELKADAGKISEMLLSEGYPVDWDNSTVIRPGLLTGSRLDAMKVSRAMNSTHLTYSSIRGKLQTKYDFLVIFKNREGDMIEFNESCTIGSPSITIKREFANISNCQNISFTSDYDNMVKLDRFVVYDSSVAKMEVYVWQN